MNYGCGAPAAVPACPRPFGLFGGGNWWIWIVLLVIVLFCTGGGGIFNCMGGNWWIWIVLILLIFPGCFGKLGFRGC